MSRLVVVVAAVLALIAVATGAAALLAGTEDGAAAGRGLGWAQRPRIVTPPALPGDRVMYGQVRNDGARDLTLRAAEVKVLDASGRALKSNGRFLQAFAGGGAGRALTLEPGRTAPLTVAWRGPGARKLTIGAVTLRIP